MRKKKLKNSEDKSTMRGKNKQKREESLKKFLHIFE